jgi:hypothetical protein
MLTRVGVFWASDVSAEDEFRLVNVEELGHISGRTAANWLSLTLYRR